MILQKHETWRPDHAAPSPWNPRQRHIASPRRGHRVIRSAGRERAEARAFERFFKNRVKQLGTLLPPAPDAPEPDTALLWSFLSRQLSEGISNEAEVLSGAPVVDSSGGGGADAGARSSAAAGRSATAARRGVVIARPAPVPDSRRTVPCPLPSWLLPADAAAAAAAAGLGGGGSAPPSQPAHQPLVHVFWDVESAHPGDRDPRLVAVEVLRLARRLGRLAGAYAYATRPAWAWVPTHFLNKYSHDNDEDEEGEGDGDESGEGGGVREGSSEGGGGMKSAPALGRVRCPVCGRLLTAPRLERHLEALHPDKPATSLAAAAIAELEAAATAAAPPPAPGRPPPPVVAGGGAARTMASSKSARTNSHRTGLGAVREYRASSGEVFRPPAGHQLGLKYVLQREGFEPRVVQNADGAADRALNGGVDRLLAALRSAGRARIDAAAAGGSAAAGAAAAAVEVQHTLVVVSGSRRHGGALGSCRQLGVRTVVVAAGPGAAEAAEAGRADALLGWEVLASGSYRI